MFVGSDRALEAAGKAPPPRFAASRRLAEDALEIEGPASTRPNPAGLLATAILAEIEYEAGYLEAARGLLVPCLSSLRTHASFVGSAQNYQLLAQISATRGTDILASQLQR